MAEPVKKSSKNPRPGSGAPGPGRPKGMPNKTTATMKQAIAAVYEKLQRDHARKQKGANDHGHFAEWAEKHPTDFYKIAAKLLPLQIGGVDDGDDSGPAPILVRFVKTEKPDAPGGG